MTTITIPKNLIKEGDLVIIPRKEYEEFLDFKKAIPVVEFTPSEKRVLKKAREDYKQRKCLRWEEIKNELANRSHKKR